MAEYICEVCGKHLKTAAGLAGHKMMAHPPLPQSAASSSPELAVAEMLEAVRDAYGRLEQRLGEFGGQLLALKAQLVTVDDKLGDYAVARLDEGKGASLKEENARLNDEVAKLNSHEYRRGYARDWAGQLTRDEYYQLGNALGHFDAPEASAAEVAKVAEERAAQAGPLAAAGQIASIYDKLISHARVGVLCDKLEKLGFKASQEGIQLSDERIKLLVEAFMKAEGITEEEATKRITEYWKEWHKAKPRDTMELLSEIVGHKIEL